MFVSPSGVGISGSSPTKNSMKQTEKQWQRFFEKVKVKREGGTGSAE